MVCPVISRSLKAFYQHVKMHQDLTLYRRAQSVKVLCSHCLKYMNSLQEFEKHIKSLPPGTKFNCPLCTKKNIATFSNYKSHKYREHTDKTVKNDGNEASGSTQYQSLNDDVTLFEMPDIDLTENVQSEDFLAPDPRPTASINFEVLVDNKKSYEQLKGEIELDLFTAIIQAKVNHGIAEAGIDEILGALKIASEKSSVIYSRKFKSAMEEAHLTENEIETAWIKLRNFHALDEIIQSEKLSTATRRSMIMKNEFELLDARRLDLGHGLDAEKSYFTYFPPQELLSRFLNDPSVTAQFKRSGQTNAKFQGLGKYYEDFFHSDAYQDILLTLPDSQKHLTPVLVGSYSDGWDWENPLAVILKCVHFFYFSYSPA